MKKEDIEKAAEIYAKEACRPLWRAGTEQVCITDFMEGAEWRINSVWHDVNEEPDPDKGDLLVGIEVMGKTAYIRQNAYYVQQFSCVRWAYVEDLIPNTED